MSASKRTEQDRPGSIGLMSAISIGIGGMVGGGIFAVLGLSVQYAKGGTPLAFLFGGIVALVTSYSYAKLSVRYPSEGGTVEFLNQAFGKGLFSGALNILLWLSYIVMLSLYASAFSSYGAVFLPEGHSDMWKHVLITSVVLLFTLLNIISAKLVGKSEEWIVLFKVIILVVFISAGFWTVDWSSMAPGEWASPFSMIGGAMIIFLAYEGFELIANTAGDVKHAARNLPRAYYAAVGFVIVLYVSIAMVTVGNLSFANIAEAEDYALAMAAKPFLGAFGFTLIAIAAVLSTASAINATLYGAARVSYVIAKDGELPAFLERKVWRRPIQGLLITTGLTIVFANSFDLSSISTMGSAGFLILFAAVNGANLKLRHQTKSRYWIPFTGILLCSIALGVLLLHALLEAPKQLWIIAVMVGLSFVIEWLYRRQRQI